VAAPSSPHFDRSPAYRPHAGFWWRAAALPFYIEVRRPGQESAKDMAGQKVIIGRMWPVCPSKVRVTVGSAEEYEGVYGAVTKIVGLPARAGVRFLY
jgi:hypothetical protein